MYSLKTDVFFVFPFCTAHSLPSGVVLHGHTSVRFNFLLDKITKPNQVCLITSVSVVSAVSSYWTLHNLFIW